MKGRDRLFKNEKYFDFPKMDKKNVRFSIFQNTLTDENFCLHRKILWSHVKRKHQKIVSIFFFKKNIKIKL